MYAGGCWQGRGFDKVWGHSNGCNSCCKHKSQQVASEGASTPQQFVVKVAVEKSVELQKMMSMLLLLLLMLI
jgi:hypothetical protein